MIRRKLMAAALATTLVLSSSVLAFADDQNITDIAGLATGKEITGTSTVNSPTINVTVPASADIIINPFKMEYTNDSITTPNKSQVISAEQSIKNESDVAVAVNVAELKAEPSEGVTLATTSTSGGKVTAKTAFMYLEVVDKNATFAEKYDAKAATQMAIPGIAASDTKTKAASKTNIITLGKKADATAEAKFKIGGDVVANPTKIDTSSKATIDDPWTSSDTISVKLKLTFTPQVAAE